MTFKNTFLKKLTFILSMLFSLSSFAQQELADVMKITETKTDTPTVLQTDEAPQSAKAMANVRPVKILLTNATPDGSRYPDNTLRVVNKSHKGADIGLLVLGALVGSFRTPVAKENYSGTKVESIAHPASGVFYSELGKSFDAWYLKQEKSTKYKNPLLIRADNFSLIYRDFDSETPSYDLYLQTTVMRKSDNAAWYAVAPVPVTCTDKYSEPARTLPEWEENDYAEVKVRAADHASECIKKITESFGELFKE